MNTKKWLVVFALLIMCIGLGTRQADCDVVGTITTVAGNGEIGFSGDNGPAIAASLTNPPGVAVDLSGNIYIADIYNQRIRKVNTAGTITTVAGNGTAGYSGDNGPADAAGLNYPYGVAVDLSGNIYIADTGNNRIRKVDTSGTITTVAGNGTHGYAGDNGPATAASLSNPTGVTVDSSGNIYIADNDNNRIRKVNTAGTIITIAGNGTAGYSGDNGPATAASLKFPFGVAVDSSGNVYIADYSNHRIRKVDTSGTITTVAGNGTNGYSGDNGPATSASLNYPHDVAVDSQENIFIADGDNNRIRKVDSFGTITTAAGNGIPTYSGDNVQATSASLNGPNGVAVDSSGNIYIADSYNNRIRKVTWTISFCTGQPDGTPCDDNNACTSNDVCSNGSCTGTPVIVCNDNNACTTDTCNPATGACVFTFINCNDNNVCTTDSCDPATGCVHTPINVNDNNACTIDTCNPATGAVYIPVNCDDNNACTADSCDPATGCVFTPIVCNDNNLCTTDMCDPATGCVFTPVTCPTGEQCMPATGQCVPCSKDVTIHGGGQRPTTTDLEIQTEFTVLNEGCIVNSSVSGITVTSGTNLAVNFTVGTGPLPSGGTLDGVSINVSNILALNNVTSAHKLILENKGNGGSDTDRMTISVQ